MKDTDETRAPLSRDEMQTEAMIVESLLKAAMAVLTSNDSEDAFVLLDMAQLRAGKLKTSLDSLYVEEEAA